MRLTTVPLLSVQRIAGVGKTSEERVLWLTRTHDVSGRFFIGTEGE